MKSISTPFAGPRGRVVRRLAPLAVFFTTACGIAACSSGFDDGDRAPNPVEDPIASTTQALSGAQYGETALELVAKCDQAVGVSVPAFDCDASNPDHTSTLVPDGNPSSPTFGPSTICDRPNHLNHQCDPGSRFHVLVNTSSAYVVAHCRKKGATDGGYNDVAVIQHNKRNGATCFYQSGVGSGGAGVASVVPNQHINAPSDPAGTEVPVVMNPSSCVGCHSNGAVIRSPYLAQLTGQNMLPGAGVIGFNADDPYRFVGNQVSDLKTYKVRSNTSSCTNCHRMGVSSSGTGTTTVFAMEAVESHDIGLAHAVQWSDSERVNTFHKNKDSTSSPLWMPFDASKPSKHAEAWDQAQADAAQSISRCAKQFKVGQPNSAQPSTPDCNITQFSGPPFGAFPKKTVMWLEAADAVFTPGSLNGPVLFSRVDWPDQTGYHNNATSNLETGLPTIGTDANGTFLQFQPAYGLCDKMEVPDSTSLHMGTDDFALVVVADYQDTPSTVAGMFIKQLPDSPWRGIGMYGSLGGAGAWGGQLGSDYQSIWTSMSYVGGSLKWVNGNWGDAVGTTAPPHIFVMRRINGTLDLRVDGKPSSSLVLQGGAASFDVTALGASIEIGCRGTQTHPFTGRIYSIGLIHTGVDDTTIKDFEASLKLRYNL
ncbi:MAG: hypothetical protein ACXVEE_04430 [Polyangiales bacterium]